VGGVREEPWERGKEEEEEEGKAGNGMLKVLDIDLGRR